MRKFASLLAAVLSLAGAPALAQRPVVLELFTSQGCNSCPPAEEFLRELSRRPDVIALELHVDYWDYIGWRDPFAHRAYTDRQRAYSRALEQRYVYTPQIVVDGRYQGVGSDRPAMLQLIEQARRAGRDGPQIELVGGPSRMVRIVGPVDRPALVWAAVLDPTQETDVQRGENGGRRLVNTNVVRRLERLAVYDGAPLQLQLLPCEPYQSVAVIVQAANGAGAIVAAKLIAPQR